MPKKLISLANSGSDNFFTPLKTYGIAGAVTYGSIRKIVLLDMTEEIEQTLNENHGYATSTTQT